MDRPGVGTNLNGVCSGDGCWHGSLSSSVQIYTVELNIIILLELASIGQILSGFGIVFFVLFLLYLL